MSRVGKNPKPQFKPSYISKHEAPGANQRLLDACEIGQYRAAEAALKEGANPNAQNHHGFTALSEAAVGG